MSSDSDRCCRAILFLRGVGVYLYLLDGHVWVHVSHLLNSVLQHLSQTHK